MKSWIVIVKSWEKGAEESAAYVETEYFGLFESEASADAYVPTVDAGLDFRVEREPLTKP
jgi:hypothetical protein